MAILVKYALVMLCCLSCSGSAVPEGMAQANVVKQYDTLYREFVFDTARDFTDVKSLNEYWKELSNNTLRYKNLGKNSKGQILSVIRMDSVIYNNSELLAYGVLRYFKTHKPAIEDIFMLNVPASVPSVLYCREDIMQAFAIFPAAAQKSAAGKKVLENLNKNYAQPVPSLTNIGSFQFRDPKGKMVSMREMVQGEHQYFLLVLGASWCKPCRIENHFLKEHIRDFQSHKIKLVGISMDTNREYWLKALDEDQCSWPQYNDPKAFESAFAKAAAVSGVPDNLLFDKEMNLLTRSRNIELILSFLSNKNQ
jgi:thiol-disulfide isomerase/thioredoxin